MTKHIVPVRTYLLVFLGLIALTGTTVAVSKIELGSFNFVAAMTIAVVKGSLVVWFFMHLRQSSSLTRLFALAGFFWMAILIVFTLSDYLSRGWVPAGAWWKSL
jgi:cytochrome c oxidase subunit 4